LGLEDLGLPLDEGARRGRLPGRDRERDLADRERAPPARARARHPRPRALLPDGDGAAPDLRPEAAGALLPHPHAPEHEVLARARDLCDRRLRRPALLRARLELARGRALHARLEVLAADARRRGALGGLHGLALRPGEGTRALDAERAVAAARAAGDCRGSGALA